MKKIIGIVFLTVLISNMFHLQHKSGKLDANLMVLMKQANAQGEVIDGGMLGVVTCYGSRTYEEGGNGSATISWTNYWMKDPIDPTDEEISNMEEDLEKYRSEVQKTFYDAQRTYNSSATGGWNIGFTAQGTVGTGYNSSYTSTTRICCGSDFWNQCTHLPPCEAYS